MTEQPAASIDPSLLVKRIQVGETHAEEELVRRYSRGVAIIVGRIARNAFTTDDLCQETFRLVLEKVRRGDLREPEKLSGFICSVARNLAIEHLRRERQVESLDGTEATLPLSDPMPDPLGKLLEKEKVEAIRQVLSELTAPRDREILRRFYLLEEEKERICADLGLSSLHFNRVLHRARERFKDLYEQSSKKKWA
jgi:RNA polymerase sigma-70 factor, ECF subfamily